MDDRLDPDIRVFTDILREDWSRHPPLDQLPTAEARQVAELVRARWTVGGPVMRQTRDVEIDTGAGALRLRIYRPDGVAAEDAPALLYIHGGGFVFFSLDTHDRLMREYADAGQFVVVGIDYPLSPEAKYPVALDHIVALVDWLGGHGTELGIDAARMAIGGDSAGANLALATCMRVRDADKNSAIRCILSNYGAFSGDVSDAAEAAYGGPHALLTQADMRYFFDQYLVSAEQCEDPYACPLSASDVSGLPPMMMIIPALDVLAEQSFALAERLRSAGNRGCQTVYPGATHSFLEAMSIAPIARQAIQDGASWIRDRLT
ncbi:alpha/beta hydrolase fold domain-containing protein [Sphingomonas sp. OK281]|uniref:alpha/beta hydrolase fold domain-containing protein n=1 Tax=Sphingomonas sp. OK281 TaxID=1881067 RepID=UPI0008F2643F|nr:alpha/beta hydrolase fold domain-containing protein [Sphingomonas sp. OK281]SFO34110.1 acetyl esterase [Sphingomonas sp. OK281]